MELQQSARCQLCKALGSLLFVVMCCCLPPLCRFLPAAWPERSTATPSPKLFFRHLLPGASSPSQKLTGDSPSLPPLVGCTSTPEKLRKQLINEKTVWGETRLLESYCCMTCLRHRFSGFVWQQEARPLRTLETNRPEKPLHPSEPPQRNSEPTWLSESFTREKKFSSALPQTAHQSGPLFQDGWAPCPSQSPDGNVPRPTPQRSGTWLPAAACPAPVPAEAAEERRPRRCGAPCAALPRERAAAQAPGARQPTTLRQGEGSDADGLRQQRARTLSWERRKRHARQAHGSLLRDPRERPGARLSLRGAAKCCSTALANTAPFHPTLHPAVHPVWYPLACVPSVPTQALKPSWCRGREPSSCVVVIAVPTAMGKHRAGKAGAL